MFDLNMDELCSGMFSDIMDRMGFHQQIITQMRRNKKMVSFMGRARIIVIKTKETDDENIRMGLSFLGTVGKDEVLFVKGSDKFAYFGELMTKLSARMGIEGIIIDGLTRDTNYTHREEIKLPILAKGYSPIDIKGRGYVHSTDVSFCCDGVQVCPGDLIYADNEAVCVIPKAIEKKVINKVKEKVEDEKHISELIRQGISVNELLKQVTEF